MKNLILTLFLTITTVSFSQLAPPSGSMKVNLNLSKSIKSSSYQQESSLPIGVGVMLGGATFITAGLLTPPTYVGGSTTERKPFFQQPRMLPIVTGALLMGTGIVISIGR